jgi:hypothetical protein
VALWAMGVQIPPPTRHLPCGTQEAPEAIIGLRGFRFPRISPSALRDHPSDNLRGLGRRLIVRMPVHVRRDGDAGVSELTRDDVQSSTRCERQSGVRVASAVESDRALAHRAAKAWLDESELVPLVLIALEVDEPVELVADLLTFLDRSAMHCLVRTFEATGPPRRSPETRHVHFAASSGT